MYWNSTLIRPWYIIPAHVMCSMKDMWCSMKPDFGGIHYIVDSYHMLHVCNLLPYLAMFWYCVLLSVCLAQCWCGPHWDFHHHWQCSGAGVQGGDGGHLRDNHQDTTTENEDGSDSGTYVNSTCVLLDSPVSQRLCAVVCGYLRAACQGMFWVHIHHVYIFEQHFNPRGI